MRNGVRRPPRGLPRGLPRRRLRPPSVRWWSVLQGFSDVNRNRVAYSAWCIYMASHLGSASTYQHIYLETETWLKNDKVICDLSFVLAFHKTWWNAEILFCQGIGDWQKTFRRWTRRRVTARTSSRCTWFWLGGGSALFPGRSARTPAFRDTGRTGRGYPRRQAAAARPRRRRLWIRRCPTSSTRAWGNHHARWLGPLVDCALAYPVKEVALAITGILLVVYDGDDYDAALLAIDAVTRVTVEDETVNLRDLVFEVTQFITKAELHEESVLFQVPQNVGDIRAWAANGGVFFGPGGARLERNMKTLILGRPIHSQLSERIVGLGNGVVKKFGKHELEARISGKVQAVANGVRVDARVASYEYEARARSSIASQAARAPETHWRAAATGLVRERRGVHLRHRNKEVVKLEVQAFFRRHAPRS